MLVNNAVHLQFFSWRHSKQLSFITQSQLYYRRAIYLQFRKRRFASVTEHDVPGYGCLASYCALNTRINLSDIALSAEHRLHYYNGCWSLVS